MRDTFARTLYEIACKDPRAKQNALITTIIGGIITVGGIIAQIALQR